MYLYFNYSASGSLRWYVKVSRKGRRIGIREEYGSPGFDAAYEAGVAALGGAMRIRRVKSTVKPGQPERRYPNIDVSQRGQVRLLRAVAQQAAQNLDQGRIWNVRFQY